MFKKMTLRKKMALLLTISVVFIGIAVWGFIYRNERREVIEENREVLSRYLGLFAAEGEGRGIEGIREVQAFWEKTYPEGRLTVINTMGEVVIDSKSDPNEMDNHYKRPEIIKAFEDGSGSELRYSKTQSEWQNYMAKRVIIPGTPAQGMVIRLSYPLEELNSLALSMAKPFLYSLEIMLFFVLLGSYLMLRFVTKPLDLLSESAQTIAAGGTARFPITNDPQIQNLSNALNSMSDSLKLSVKEAQERKEELSLLVGALPVGVILIDEARKIRYMNSAASKICGRAGNEPARGLSIEVILPSDEMCSMLDEGDGRRMISLSRSGGSKIEMSTLTLTRGRMIVLEDLTDKIKLDEARREFFIDAGHEFQTPLTVIRTGLELLKSGDSLTDIEDIKAVDSMIRQQERISGLVEDLLLLVKLDVDPQGNRREEVDLKEIVRDIISDVKELPASRKIEIKAILPEEDITVRTVYGDLRRALFNLVENGVKYVSSSRETEGRVEITVKEDDHHIHILVDDNGPGVTEEDRDIIFERFRRGDSHRARSRSSAGGYGLGLSISRKISEREGGSLELGRSSLGGASFIMTLPKTELTGNEEI
ncbi:MULTISPECIES: ATP-binding protein [Synergistaceae]|uniref:sensor histidine kinase n=1 Tax=Synergistaceae TaxID=649777 RepID=UPI003AEDDAE4|nr:ATP-binding protein [Synergistaceae bacterium DZ-S4]